MTIQKQTSWEIQKSVVFALFIRELKSRFGVFKLGYFWAVMGPVFGIAALCFIRTALGSGPIQGVHFPLFFASGVLIYKIFTGLGQSTLGQIEANMGLMSYQRIKPLDPLIARVILEGIIIAAAMIVVLGGLAYFGFTFRLGSVLRAIEVFLLMTLFSFGFGLFLATISPFFQDFKKIVPVVLQPLFFISGIFFSVNSLPESLLPYLLWNPILHGVELGRASLFEGYQSDHVSLSYLYLSALFSITLGLMLFRRFRIRLVTSGTIKLA